MVSDGHRHAVSQPALRPACIAATSFPLSLSPPPPRHMFLVRMPKVGMPACDLAARSDFDAGCGLRRRASKASAAPPEGGNEAVLSAKETPLNLHIVTMFQFAGLHGNLRQVDNYLQEDSICTDFGRFRLCFVEFMDRPTDSRTFLEFTFYSRGKMPAQRQTVQCSVAAAGAGGRGRMSRTINGVQTTTSGSVLALLARPDSLRARTPVRNKK